MIVWDDIKDFGEKLHNEWWKRYREVKLENIAIPINGLGANGATDSNGDLDSLPIFTNKIGRETLIGRVMIQADGIFPSTGHKSGYAYLFVGERFAGFAHDFLPVVGQTQVFPAVFLYSSRNMIRLGFNDTLSLYVNGGPTSTNISAFVWGEALPNSASTKIV